MQTIPKTVTYKEIMIVYGINKRNAEHKISVIRSVLGKNRNNNVLVVEFCKAENLEPEIFYSELKQFYDVTRIKKNLPTST